MSPRHKCLQFSLRSFLAVVTVFAIWLGWKVDRARKQRAAVAAFEAAGGIVQYDWQPDIRAWTDLPSLKTVYIEYLGLPSTHELEQRLRQELPGCKIERLDGLTAYLREPDKTPGLED